MNVVRQPVEERAGQTFRSEHFSPFVERQIGGDDRRSALVAL